MSPRGTDDRTHASLLPPQNAAGDGFHVQGKARRSHYPLPATRSSAGPIGPAAPSLSFVARAL